MAYVTKHELRNHKRRIHKFVYKRPVFDRPFKCDMCTCSYSKLKSLTRHRKVFHTDFENFKCAPCNKIFQNKQILQLHIENHHRDKKPYEYKCGICQEEFKSFKLFKKHMTNFHKVENSFTYEPKPDLKCQFCNKEFKVPYQRKYHEDAVHKGIKIKCEKCDKYVTKKGLKPAKHNCAIETVPKSSPKKKIKTEASNIIYQKLKQIALNNSSVHEEVKKPICNEEKDNPISSNFQTNLTYCIKCKKQYGSEEKFHDHMKTVHPLDPLVTESNFKTQEKSDHDYTNENVKIQDKIIKLPTFKKHAHEGLKRQNSYQCDICSMTFDTKHGLSRHKSCSHKKSECKSCGITFDNSDLLKAHVTEMHEKTRTSTSGSTLKSRVVQMTEIRKRIEKIDGVKK